MKTQRDRTEEARREKLAQIEEDVKQGRLLIREMTKNERKLYPPRPHVEKPRRGQRG